MKKRLGEKEEMQDFANVEQIHQYMGTCIHQTAYEVTEITKQIG